MGWDEVDLERNAETRNAITFNRISFFLFFFFLLSFRNTYDSLKEREPEADRIKSSFRSSSKMSSFLENR